MHPAHPTVKNHLSTPSSRPPEDILLEGFEQAGRRVTEHVLDYLLEQTGAERILLVVAHADESPILIARQAGKKTIPAEGIHPPGQMLPGENPAEASPCWQLALSLHPGATTGAELFLDAPRQSLTARLDTSSKRSSAMLSISLLLDELKKKRAVCIPHTHLQ